MATKVAEAYVEIYPQLNNAKLLAMKAALASRLTSIFNSAEKDIARESAKTTAQVQRNDQAVARTRKEATNAAVKDETRLASLRSRFSQEFLNQQKSQENAIHKTATAFRTLGTVGRGIAISSAVLGSFNTLRVLIGAVVTALPIMTAGLVALPAVLAGLGATALVVHAAFYGIGQAIRDSSTDAVKFQKDMAKLAPGAQRFVMAFVNAKKLMPRLQDSFFSAPTLRVAESGFKGFILRIRGSLTGLSKTTGGIFGALLGVATGPSGTRNINIILQGTKKTLDGIRPGLVAVTTSLLSLAARGTGHGTQGINGFLEGIATRLNKINVAKVFEAGGRAINTFKPVLQNIGTVIGSVFKNVLGGKAGTQGAFGAFGAGLSAIAKFVQSGVGIKFEQQLGGTLRILSGGVLQIVSILLKAIAITLAKLYPAISPFVAQVVKLFHILIPIAPLLGLVLRNFLVLATYLLRFLNPAITYLVNFLSRNQTVFSTVATGVLLIVGAMRGMAIIEGVTKAVRGIILGFKLLIPLLGTVDAEANANPLGAIVIAITAIVVAIYFLHKHWKVIWGAIIAVSRSVFNFLTHGFGQLTLLILGPIAPLAYLLLHWRKTWAVIVLISKSLYHDLFNWLVHPVENFFVRQIPHALIILGGWFSRIFNFIGNYVSAWWRSEVSVFGHVRDFFTKVIPGWLITMKNWFFGVFAAIGNRVSTWFHRDIVGVFSLMKTFVTKTVPSWIVSMKNALLNGIRATVIGIQHIWHTLTAVFERPIEWVINHVLNGLAKTWNAIVGAIPKVGKHLQIPTFKNPGDGPTVAVPAYSAGGQVPRALGGPTQDNIPIMASGGEYIFSTKAVQALGPGYLDALHRIGRKISGDPSAAHVFTQGRYSSGGLVNPAVVGRVAGTLQFLKNIAGHIPYVFGAVGPNAFDCSGLVGEVWARLMGAPSNHRYFTTGDEASFLQSHGFSSGSDTSGFTVGLTSPPHHTVGILGGHRFEAAHTGTTMRFDDGATSALSMANKYHMTGATGWGPLSGFLLTLMKFPGGALGYLKHSLGNKMAGLPMKGGAGALIANASVNDFIDAGATSAQTGLNAAASAAAKAAVMAPGVALGRVGSSQVDAWIAQASKYTNIPLSWVPGVKTIIARESGGNPMAINRTDINAQRGDPSRGLMQTIGSTFSAYRSPRLPNNIYDPVANIVAGINYIRSRYGSIFNVQQANPNMPPKGYRLGGVVRKYDTGGIIPPGYNGIVNGTGKNEFAFTADQVRGLRGGDTHVTVILDGVDVTHRAHVKKNNTDLVGALNRRSGKL